MQIVDIVQIDIFDVQLRYIRWKTGLKAGMRRVCVVHPEELGTDL